MLVSLTRFWDLAHGEPPRPQGSGGTSSWEAEPKHNMCGAALIPFLFGSECRQEGEWAQNWDGAQERSGGWLDTYPDHSEVTRQASRSFVPCSQDEGTACETRGNENIFIGPCCIATAMQTLSLLLGAQNIFTKRERAPNVSANAVQLNESERHVT